MYSKIKITHKLFELGFNLSHHREHKVGEFVALRLAGPLWLVQLVR